MKIKTIVAVFSLFLMVGCQSTLVTNYVYVPKELSQTVIDELNKNLPTISKTGSSSMEMKFIEHESYIQMTKKAESGFAFSGGDLTSGLYNFLCGDKQNDFLNFIRTNGVGVKYALIDDRGMKEIGPWNTDICNI